MCRGFHKVEHLLQEEISPLLDFAHRGQLLFPHLHHTFSSIEAAHVLERFFLLLFLACETLVPQPGTEAALRVLEALSPPHWTIISGLLLLFELT